MQDPSIYSQINPQFPEPELLKCPRCDSSNTKFCYYNNYNLSQPRHYCKNCKRYWTKGGSLRNIPIGGGSRKNTTKRSSSSSCSKRATTTSSKEPVLLPPPPPQTSSSPSSSSSTKPEPEHPFGIIPHQLSGFENNNGPVSSLLVASSGPQFGNFMEALNPNNNRASNLQLGEFTVNPNSNSGSGSVSGSDVVPQSGNNNINGYWNGRDGWPDLAIYTPDGPQRPTTHDVQFSWTTLRNL